MPSDEIEATMLAIIGSMLDDFTLKLWGTVERETVNGVTYIKRYPVTEMSRLEVQCGFRVCAIEPQDLTEAVMNRRRHAK